MQVSRAAAVIALVALALLAAAGPAYRMGLPLSWAFTMLRWAAYGGAAGALVALPWALWTYRKGQRRAVLVAVAALVIGLFSAAVPYRWYRQAQRLPLIHDITTDLEHPPTFTAIVPLRENAPNTLERAPEIGQLQRQGYPDLAPVTMPEPAGLVFDRAQAVAGALGWDIVRVDKAAGLLEATDTTRWFGFQDDVVVRLTPWGTGTRVDVRSVSRVGSSDVGTNARRVRAFLDALQQP